MDFTNLPLNICGPNCSWVTIIFVIVIYLLIVILFVGLALIGIRLGVFEELSSIWGKNARDKKEEKK